MQKPSFQKRSISRITINVLVLKATSIRSLLYFQESIQTTWYCWSICHLLQEQMWDIREVTHNTYFVHPIYADEVLAFFSLEFVMLELLHQTNCDGDERVWYVQHQGVPSPVAAPSKVQLVEKGHIN